jgi:hypothetical protein
MPKKNCILGNHPKQGVKIMFCKLDIIQNSGIIVLVKYGLNREKISELVLQSFFMLKNKVIFF